MKREIQNCVTWLTNKVSETIIYDNWSNDFKNEENKKNFKRFYDEIKKYIDFNNLTIDEAMELRFGKWSEDMPNLWLFPLWIVPIIPEGLEVMNINGDKFKYNSETVDNDARFGCVCYGIEIKE